jgi:hypothetical protein
VRHNYYVFALPCLTAGVVAFLRRKTYVDYLVDRQLARAAAGEEVRVRGTAVPLDELAQTVLRAARCSGLEVAVRIEDDAVVIRALSSGAALPDEVGEAMPARRPAMGA